MWLLDNSFQSLEKLVQANLHYFQPSWEKSTKLKEQSVEEEASRIYHKLLGFGVQQSVRIFCLKAHMKKKDMIKFCNFAN